MKIKRNIKSLVLMCIVMLPVFAKAQIDTAWVTNEHASQYIFPPIIDDVNYNNQLNEFRVVNTSSPFYMGVGSSRDNMTRVTGVAQKFDVQHGDSVSIMGVATVMTLILPSTYGIFDTIKISILNDRFTEIYSKSFYTCDSTGDFYGRFAEYMFDEPITLYEDYYIAVENCCLHYTGVAFFALDEYAWLFDYNLYECTPYGINTKYKPYVTFGCNNDWIYVDDVVGWVFSYDYNNLAVYETNPELDCDTLVYEPVGVCPIKYVADSIVTGGGSAGDDTTSTGGGSQDSYIATVLADKDIELYPNPADEVLNIRSDYNITEIEVHDAMNRVIERWELNTRELTLDVASYKSGTYFIIIKTDKGSLTKKFIVR